MSENTKVITTGDPSSNTGWTESSFGNGRTPMSYSVNSVSTGMQYSDAARENSTGPIGTFGNSNKSNGCRLSFSHMT